MHRQKLCNKDAIFLDHYGSKGCLHKSLIKKKKKKILGFESGKKFLKGFISERCRSAEKEFISFLKVNALRKKKIHRCISISIFLYMQTCVCSYIFVYLHTFIYFFQFLFIFLALTLKI